MRHAGSRLIMLQVKSFARSNIIPKASQILHPRAGRYPIKWLIKMDSRLRRNDGDWKFCVNFSQFGFIQSSQVKDSPKVIAA